MGFIGLAICALFFYWIGSLGRKKDFRALADQLHNLENAVRELTKRACGEMSPDERADVALSAGEDDVAKTPAAAMAPLRDSSGYIRFPEVGIINAESIAAMIRADAEKAREADVSDAAAGPPAPEAEAFTESFFESGAEPDAPADDAKFSPVECSVPEEIAGTEYGVERTEEADFKPAPVFTAEVEKYFRFLMDFIRGGNLWVAGGVIMLLIGFAFLAQLSDFSIEMRIVLATVTGMAMVGLGLRLRLRRRMYALIMQGGGISVLYLSAFASAKLTDMLPPVAALVIMTALIIPAVTLAVVQNAQILALFGFVGGFAAPILLSDGSGNYIALFSCYALLNLGILAICRYRLWRWLNFAGAFCSFVVMGYWGITNYDVAMFSTTEPFLLGFVLIYILITLGAVRREEFSFTEPLDAILACGIPFVAALFQWRLAMDIPHALSISSVAFGAFFLFLAFAVWKIWGERTRRLAEFYLANGVVLANLAVPLELSDGVTSTIWAVEGAILFFFACRTRSWRIKAVALLLQCVGAIAFFRGVASHEHTLLSTSIIALAALASACFQKLDADDPERLTPETFNKWLGDAKLELALAVAGLLWWYGGLGLETARFADSPLAMFFLAVCLSSVPLFFAEKATGLRELLYAAIAVPLLTAACSLAAYSYADFTGRLLFPHALEPGVLFPVSWPHSPLSVGVSLLFRHNFLVGWSAAAWAAFAATQVGMLYLCRSRLQSLLHAWWGGVFALVILFMLTSSGRGVALDFNLSLAWGDLASVFPALIYVAALVLVLQRPEKMPLSGDHVGILFGWVPMLLFVPLGFWLLRGLFEPGSPAPLPVYIPLLNPLEVQQILCIGAFAVWQRAIHGIKDAGVRFVLPLRPLLLLLDALVFLWLHSMLFRAIFFFTGTPMTQAWDHASFQVLLLILWGVWGMAHLIVGNRSRVRLVWVIGACLMVADTAKLFFVDLADKGTLFRAVSFFVLGGIFLLVGWLAPLPPSRKAGEDEQGGAESGPSEPLFEDADATAKENSNATPL